MCEKLQHFDQVETPAELHFHHRSMQACLIS